MLTKFKDPQVELDNKFFDTLQAMNSTGVLALFSTRRDKSHPYTYFSKDIHNLVKRAHNSRYNAGNRNQYLTINSFRKHIRRRAYTVGLNGLFIDADLMKNGIDKGQFLWPDNITKLCKLSGLPEPTILEDSGHGAYFIYLFKRQIQVNNPIIEHMWGKLEAEVVNKFNQGCLKMYGVKPGDTKATDSTRVLRIPNTNNVKQVFKDYEKYHDGPKYPKARLSWFDPTNRRDMFTYWINKYIPLVEYKKHRANTRRNSHKKPARHPGKATKVHSIFYSFKIPKGIKWQRTRDILKLLPLRNYNMKGYRDIYLFIYACLVIRINGTAGTIRDIKHLNKEFKEPLEPSGINNLIIEIKHSHLEKYRFKSSTIIKWLKITPKEQRAMLNIMDHKEANRRKQQRRDAYKIKVQRRNSKIVSMLKNGYSRREVAKRLAISVSTVARVSAKFKREAPEPTRPRVDRLILILHKQLMKRTRIATRLNVSLKYIAKVLQGPPHQQT